MSETPEELKKRRKIIKDASKLADELGFRIDTSRGSNWIYITSKRSNNYELFAHGYRDALMKLKEIKSGKKLIKGYGRVPRKITPRK